MRRFVRERKQELGLTARETFVPQVYDWGGEAQVDWYEAVAEIGGERQSVHHFAMRSMASGGAFSRGVLSRHTAGISGSARVGIWIFRGRVPTPSLATT